MGYTHRLDGTGTPRCFSYEGINHPMLGVTCAIEPLQLQYSLNLSADSADLRFDLRSTRRLATLKRGHVVAFGVAGRTGIWFLQIPALGIWTMKGGKRW